jgi:hypothetical protein
MLIAIILLVACLVVLAIIGMNAAGQGSKVASTEEFTRLCLIWSSKKCTDDSGRWITIGTIAASDGTTLKQLCESIFPAEVPEQSYGQCKNVCENSCNYQVGGE